MPNKDDKHYGGEPSAAANARANRYSVKERVSEVLSSVSPRADNSIKTLQQRSSLDPKVTSSVSSFLNQVERRVFMTSPQKTVVIMKTNLSHILPVADAYSVLGEDTVRRVIRTILKLRRAGGPSGIVPAIPTPTLQGSLDPHGEELTLLKALRYQPIPSPTGGISGGSPLPPPPAIVAAWQRMTKSTGPLALDKATFLRFAVPACNVPHSGHGGHLGLFDCLAHALQASTQQSVAPQNVILLPDILIFFAICRSHTPLGRGTNNGEQLGGNSNDSTETGDKQHDDDGYGTMLLAVMVFRIYDCYQKRGTITRDTIHKYLSDVHGEDSFKAPSVRKMLDFMFTMEAQEANSTSVAVGQGVRSLTASQFCNGIHVTMTKNKNNFNSHILLDWVATLGSALLPVEDLPQSTQSYVEMISSSHRSITRICQKYALAENRLYEIKRRFHSMVESSNAVVEGNGTLPMTEQDGEASINNTPPDRPRHIITQDAFVLAVTGINDELGHGGYLPKDLAELTFQGGCPTINTDSVNPNQFWVFYDVLLFGCEAVRVPSQRHTHNNSMPHFDFAKFAFRTFCLLPGDDSASEDDVALDASSVGKQNHQLTRSQIGKMLLLLLSHQAFRLRVDSPEDNEDEEKVVKQPKPATVEDTMVDISAASLLRLLPPNVESSDSNKYIRLSLLVDRVLEEISDDGKVSNVLDFAGFCKWHFNATTDEDSLLLEESRLGPYLLELRLIASVLFGIPPTRASFEKFLIGELRRRHKYRYPQTDVSRRGPRGTVWYIIDDLWYRSWRSRVIDQHPNPHEHNDDDDDGRGVGRNGNPRNLTKINNTGLMAESGTLALRPGIRWRQDYEIIAPLAWSALQAWYDGGPPIHRSVVRYIPSDLAKNPHSKSSVRIRTEHEIELYPYFVTVFLCDATSRGKARPFQQYVPISRVSPVRVVLVQLCKGLDIDPKYGRLWVMESKPQALNVETKPDWVLNLDVNIADQAQANDDATQKGHSLVLLLELKDKDSGKWPRGLDGRTWTFKDVTKKDDSEEEALMGDGIVGLYNMGNTCYLNASIQCLSHTPIFRDYFTSKAYLHDINTTNPLGHEGRLAQVSAVLITSLWKRFAQSFSHHPKRVTAPGVYAPVNAPALTPKTFKESIGKFNDHFVGNEQHDAQELLAFLLGGLSEDLNRIVEKPYIEAPDSDGRPDSELADIWWSNHLKREMSIIVALFTGQYKSLLTCRSCKYESARFEPFSFLQLPLPEDDHIPVTLIFYPRANGADAMKYSVRVPHDGKLLSVLMNLAKVRHTDIHAVPLGHDGKAAVAEKVEDNEDSKNLEKIYQQTAQNMAVVDMRDGYIFKIAPNSWGLPDLQNKDTGELPLLHVYELEPLPEVDEGISSIKEGDVEKKDGASGDALDSTSSAEGNSEDSSEDQVEDVVGAESSSQPVDKINIQEKKTEKDALNSETHGIKHSFLAIAQRRPEMVSPDQLHPFTQRLFGTPLLLRVVDLEGFSGKDLYDLIAKRIRNLVPKSALRFLVDSKQGPIEVNTTNANESSPANSKEATPRNGSRSRRHKTTCDMEEVAAGDVPRYGFRLRITSRDGRRCALCPWYDCCIGCFVPDNDYPTIATCGDSIVMDWHFSVDIATSGFGLRNQADGTSITPALRARTTSVSVRNHSSCGDNGKKNGYAGAISLEDCLDAFAEEEKIPEAYCSKCTDFRVQTKRMSLWRLPPVVIIQLKRFQFTQHMRRKLRDLVAFPVEGLDLSRIVTPDGSRYNEGGDESGAKIDKKDRSHDDSEDEHLGDGTDGMPAPPPMSPHSKHHGRVEMLYDLYGVVHHQGALSGGHYVASLKSESDGQWRLYNDAQVYEIHSRDVVDSSAYILFYIRRDVKTSSLKDFWDTRVREGEGLTEEEVENLMKGRADRCVIS